MARKKNQLTLIKNKLKKYVQVLTRTVKVDKMILFGSYAKGKAHEFSDIDIALVMQNNGDMIQTQIDLMKLRRMIDLRIEPHPFYVNDFNISNPVANEIIKHGIELS